MEVTASAGSSLMVMVCGAEAAKPPFAPLLEEIMRDNPMGQKDECTPVSLVREVST